MLLWIILIITITSLLGLTGGVLLLWFEQRIKQSSRYLISFAVGALLAAAFADLLPELVESSTNIHRSLLVVLVGILAFYLLEKLLIVYHCHNDEHCEIHGSSSPLIIISDSFHNFLDGAVVAGAFVTDWHLGILTALAILFHELPQEIGDFAVLWHNGMAKGKIILWNVISAMASVVGGIAAWLLTERINNSAHWLLAFAIGNFIYIGCADLIPITNQERRSRSVIIHFATVLIGIGIIIFAGSLIAEH